MRATLTLAALAALILAPAVCADTITLEDGRELHGRLIGESKESIDFLVARGGIMVIEKARITAFIENDNYGLDYGAGVKPTTPAEPSGAAKGEAKPEGSKAGPKVTASSPKAAAPASDAASYAKQLPDPSESLNAATREALLAALFERRPWKDALLPATEPSPKEQDEIDLALKELGYVRKVGNRDRRERAVIDLIAMGPKVFPSLGPALRGNMYERRNAARILGAVLKNDLSWRWYAAHFGFAEALVSLVGDQSDKLSWAVRADANAALEALMGQGVGFEANEDQFRTINQAKAQKAWGEAWTKAKAELDAADALRAAQHEALLAAWSEGTGGRAVTQIIADAKPGKANPEAPEK